MSTSRTTEHEVAKFSEDASERPLSTGDLARICRTTMRTVRFYEEAGLISASGRSEGGHRLFCPRELPKLQMILELREVGLSLNAIRALFQLKGGCRSPREASVKLSEALGQQLATMQKKINVLRTLRSDFATTVAAIDECRDCPSDSFPCKDCDLMTRPDLPRAMKLFWGK